jgi:dynein heavy chain
MKKELAKESADIVDLVALVRTDINSHLRKSVNCLIILDVHARDIVEAFVRDSKLSSKEFAWESQLRFYWSP